MTRAAGTSSLAADGRLPASELVPIDVVVNGRPRRIAVAPHHTLLDVLRDDLRLTGTKECCLVGECGACTVMLNGRNVDSCLVLAVEADGGEVRTIEGLAGADGLAPLQRAFLETAAAQCGFCIPGQLMAAHALLQRVPRPSRPEVEEGLAGNLCRCAGYEQIIEAVLLAATDGHDQAGADLRAGSHGRTGADERAGSDARASTADPGRPAHPDGRPAVLDPASVPDARLAPQ